MVSALAFDFADSLPPQRFCPFCGSMWVGSANCPMCQFLCGVAVINRLTRDAYNQVKERFWNDFNAPDDSTV